MRIIILLLLTIFSSLSFAEVKSFTLDNGMKILVKEDHRAPVAVSMVWYNVGSTDEKSGKTGLSHALEHMMFKGTKTYSAGVFSRLIAANGGQENAMTYFDYTAYHEKIAASRLPLVFKLEADRMRHLSLDADAFNKEIKVIREERRLRVDDNPQSLAFERFMATANLALPYHQPVIGWMNDLYQMDIKDLRAWYQRYYAPNNATLVVVGDVEPEKVYQLAKKYFGPLQKSFLPKRKKIREPKPLGKKEIKIYAPAQLPVLMLGYSVPSATVAKKAEEPYALELISAILDGGESGRFSKDLIRGKHLASNVGVFYDMYSRYSSQFVMFGIPSRDKSIAELKAGMLQEIEDLQTQLVSKRELQRVKTQLIAQHTFEKDSIFGQAMSLGLLETVGLGWQESDAYQKKIQNVTAEQIQATAQRYFQEKAMTEAELIPVAKGDKKA